MCPGTSLFKLGTTENEDVGIWEWNVVTSGKQACTMPVKKRNYLLYDWKNDNCCEELENTFST